MAKEEKNLREKLTDAISGLSKGVYTQKIRDNLRRYFGQLTYRYGGQAEDYTVYIIREAGIPKAVLYRHITRITDLPSPELLRFFAGEIGAMMISKERRELVNTRVIAYRDSLSAQLKVDPAHLQVAVSFKGDAPRVAAARDFRPIRAIPVDELIAYFKV